MFLDAEFRHPSYDNDEWRYFEKVLNEHQADFSIKMRFTRKNTSTFKPRSRKHPEKTRSPGTLPRPCIIPWKISDDWLRRKSAQIIVLYEKLSNNERELTELKTHRHQHSGENVIKTETDSRFWNFEVQSSQTRYLGYAITNSGFSTALKGYFMEYQSALDG